MGVMITNPRAVEGKFYISSSMRPPQVEAKSFKQTIIKMIEPSCIHLAFNGLTNFKARKAAVANIIISVLIIISLDNSPLNSL